MRYIFLVFISFSLSFADAHIFVYHRFGDSRYPSANTTKEQLIQQFEYLKEHNYKIVPIEKILTNIKAHKDIPNNWVALTIDDGYKSFYDNGLEIFKKYNYPFSVYVYVQATTQRYGDYMSWKQLKEISKYGTVGLHSYAHPRLQNLTNKEIIDDTKKAYDIFVKKMGYTPKIYVYPYGEYDPRVKKILTDNFDFEAILNQNTGSVTKNTDIKDIPRVAVIGRSNIKYKLRYKTFNVKWHEPNVFPKNGILKRISANVDPKYNSLKLYITGEGWRDINVTNGLIDQTLNIYLKNTRTRVLLGPDIFTVSNHLINKSKLNKGVKQ